MHDLTLYHRTLAMCQDAQSRTKQTLVFGMLTALIIHGIEIPRLPRLQERLQRVSAIARTARHRTTLKGVQFYVWTHPMQTIETPSGIIITDIFTTLMQVAKLCTREELTVLFDIVQRRQGTLLPTFINDLIDFIDTTGIFHGKAKIRWALHHTRPNTDSSMETRLRLTLTTIGRLPEPEINHQITERKTGKIWFLDLAYPRYKIAIEYQGGETHSSSYQVQVDSDKNTRLQILGWTCLTISAQHLRDILAKKQVITWIRHEIRRRKKHKPRNKKAI